MLTKDGSRVRQQYISEKDGKVVERAEMVKGYEFEKDKFVLFEPSELKALEEGSSHVVDIVAFVPEKSIDPIYYDKAYMLAPDKRGACVRMFVSFFSFVGLTSMSPDREFSPTIMPS